MSASEAKYWELKKRGGPKRPGKRSKKMQVINDYLHLCLPEIMRANPAFSPKEIAEEIILDGESPHIDVKRCRVPDQGSPEGNKRAEGRGQRKIT